MAPEAFAYGIPDAFADADAAPLLCAGIICYRAFRLSGVDGPGRLGMYGFGSSAHIMLHLTPIVRDNSSRRRTTPIESCTPGSEA